MTAHKIITYPEAAQKVMAYLLAVDPAFVQDILMNEYKVRSVMVDDAADRQHAIGELLGNPGARVKVDLPRLSLSRPRASSFIGDLISGLVSVPAI